NSAALFTLGGFHHGTLHHVALFALGGFVHRAIDDVMFFALAGFGHVSHLVVTAIDNLRFVNRLHYGVAFFAFGGFVNRLGDHVAPFLELRFHHRVIRGDFSLLINRFIFDAVTDHLAFVENGLADQPVSRGGASARAATTRTEA